MPACGMPLRGGDDIRSVNAYPLLKITQVMMGGRHPGRLRLLSIEPPALWERWRGDELIASSPGPIAVRDARRRYNRSALRNGTSPSVMFDRMSGPKRAILSGSIRFAAAP